VGGQWLMLVILATQEAEIRRVVVQCQPEPHLQNNQSKIDWRCDSSSRAPALQTQSSNPSPTKINKVNGRIKSVFYLPFIQK
jgi:hypothetical protein